MSRVKKYDNILTKEFIEEEYIRKNRTSKDIANSLNIDLRTFFNYCSKYSIKKPNNQDITNQKFNSLVPIKIVDKTYYGNIWLCKCDCGNNTIALAANLKSNKIKTCGCALRKVGSGHHTWKGVGGLSGNKWCAIKDGAKNRKISFNITKDYIWNLGEINNWICPLSGLNLSFDKNINTASIDRIDSKVGYEVGNVWIVHKDINLIKASLSLQDFILMCNDVTSPIVNNNVNLINDLFISFYKNILYNAKKRNIDFLIDKQNIIDLYNKQEGRCAITNRDITLPFNTNNFRLYTHTSSLDRIDSNKQYTKDNIQWVHKQINQSRKHLNMEYYKHLCKLVCNKYI